MLVSSETEKKSAPVVRRVHKGTKPGGVFLVPLSMRFQKQPRGGDRGRGAKHATCLFLFLHFRSFCDFCFVAAYLFLHFVRSRPARLVGLPIFRHLIYIFLSLPSCTFCTLGLRSCPKKSENCWCSKSPPVPLAAAPPPMYTYRAVKGAPSQQQMPEGAGTVG